MRIINKMASFEAHIERQTLLELGTEKSDFRGLNSSFFSELLRVCCQRVHWSQNSLSTSNSDPDYWPLKFVFGWFFGKADLSLQKAQSPSLIFTLCWSLSVYSSIRALQWLFLAQCIPMTRYRLPMDSYISTFYWALSHRTQACFETRYNWGFMEACIQVWPSKIVWDW